MKRIIAMAEKFKSAIETHEEVITYSMIWIRPKMEPFKRTFNEVDNASAIQNAKEFCIPFKAKLVTVSCGDELIFEDE